MKDTLWVRAFREISEMKGYSIIIIIITALISASLCLSACSSLPGFASIDWVDFIKLNDITYVYVYKVDSIDAGSLLPFEEVKFKVSDNITNSRYKIKNGDAAYITAGTRIYSLEGYSTNFRLAVIKEHKLLVYEADTNPGAQMGGDLLDIGGKVNYISINSNTDGTTILASIKDQTQIDDLVQMILAAQINQTINKTGSQQYFLEFHFKDGTASHRVYWQDTGILERGIQLPEKARQIIDRALSTP